jgi:Fe-S cluster biosynthesis and repair protein YggX
MMPSARTVNCAKLKRRLPGLARPPFPGELGKRVYENISQAAWDMWKTQQTLLINHYQMALADPEAQKFLREQMVEFLFKDEDQPPEGWTPENQGGEKGATKGGQKGAPATQQK